MNYPTQAGRPYMWPAMVTWAIGQDAGTPTNKLILIILATRADVWTGRTGRIDQAELAQTVGISLRQTSRCITQLVARSLIARGPEPKGTHRSYQLMVPLPPVSHDQPTNPDAR